MRGDLEPSCSPGHISHSSGHCAPLLGTVGSPSCPTLPGDGHGNPCCIPTPHLSSRPSVWHKHRTFGSQLSKEGQEHELGGHKIRSLLLEGI